METYKILDMEITQEELEQLSIEELEKLIKELHALSTQFEDLIQKKKK